MANKVSSNIRKIRQKKSISQNRFSKEADLALNAFVCRSDEGYKTVLEAYRESAPIIKQALDAIKKAYLG